MFKKPNPYFFLLIGLALFALCGNAQAATGGTGLPMEAPIDKLRQSLCGPIAFGIALCAVMAAFGAIIFVGHMFGDFVRIALYIALGISCLAAAPGFASALGISGATIGGVTIQGSNPGKVGYGLASHSHP